MIGEAFGTDSREYIHVLGNLVGAYEQNSATGKDARSVTEEYRDRLREMYGTEHPAYIQALGRMAFLEERSGNVEAEIEILKIIGKLVLAESGVASHEYQATAERIGSLYIESENYVQAKDFCKTQIAEFKEQRVPPFWLLTLAKACDLLGDTEEAKVNYEQAIEIQKTLGAPPNVDALIRLSMYYDGIGQYKRVGELIDEAISSYWNGVPPEKPSYPFLLALKALHLDSLGNRHVAMSDAIRAFEILMSLKSLNLLEAATVHSAVASGYKGLGEYDGSLKFNQFAIDLIENTKSAERNVVTWGRLGWLYQERANTLLLMGKTNEAVSAAKRAVRVLEEHAQDQFMLRGFAYRTLSGSYLAKGMLDEADEAIGEGKKMLAKADNSTRYHLRLSLLSTESMLAVFHNDLGKAETLALKAIESLNEDDPRMALFQNNLAYVYQKKNELLKAEMLADASEEGMKMLVPKEIREKHSGSSITVNEILVWIPAT